jgi:uncharacterized membrane protein
MLLVGGVVGALFAAFSLAISAFSIPLMYDRQVDALTAMGQSWALVWNNRRAMIVWGMIVLVLFVLSLATALARAGDRLPAARARDLARLQGHAPAAP